MRHISKNIRPIVLGSILLVSYNSANAEPDFERIHKDITVMSNIIKGAFESDDECRGCKPRIEANYLAEQGAVFSVRIPGGVLRSAITLTITTLLSFRLPRKCNM